MQTRLGRARRAAMRLLPVRPGDERGRAAAREIQKPTDRDIDLAMNGNICRCATYVRIRAAIHDAAAHAGGLSHDRHSDIKLSRRVAAQGRRPASSSACICRRCARAQSGAAQAFAPTPARRAFAPNAFVRIGTDDTVTVLSQAYRVRPGTVHRPRDAGRRGARRRLVADARRARAGRSPSSTRTSRSACRAPAARPRSPIPTSRCARPAPPRARCWCRPRRKPGSVPAGEITVERGVIRHAGVGARGPVRRVRRGRREAAGAGRRCR